MKFENFDSMVGNTPLVEYRTEKVKGARIWVKMESFNPTGSVKDRAGLYLIKDALKNERLIPGKTILDASSGNMACALAYFGRILGYKVRVVCSSKLTDDKASFLKYFGCDIELIGNFTIEGNRYCAELAKKPDSEYCFLDQLHNFANPLAHYETTGPEILMDIPNVSAIIGSLGSGGTLNGIGRYIKEHSPTTKIYSVEAKKGTKLPGTGSFLEGDYITPFITEAREKNYFDGALSISESEAVATSREISSKGFFCGLQTAGVITAAINVIHQEKIQGDVVVISGDSGWKNLNKLLSL